MRSKTLVGELMEDELPNDVVWLINPNGRKPVLVITVYGDGNATVTIARNPTAKGSWKPPLKHHEKLGGTSQLTLDGLLGDGEIQQGQNQFGIKAILYNPGKEAIVRMAIMQDGKIVKARSGGVLINKPGEINGSLKILIPTSNKAVVHYFSIGAEQ